MKRAGRANGRTVSAADTLGAVRRPGRIHTHAAGRGAFSAVNAFGAVQLQSMERYAVEKTVDRAEGTQIFAEGTPHDQAREHRRREDQAFPRKQPSELGADQAVFKGSRDQPV